MRDRLIELLTNMYLPIKVRNSLGSYDTVGGRRFGEFEINGIANHLLANGVIVPPCKVGQTVYLISRGKIIPMIVNSISFNGNCEYMLNCHFEDEEQHGYSLLSLTEKTRDYYWALTKEEAEKALAERSGE